MINAFEIPEFKVDVFKLQKTYLNNTSVWATYGEGTVDCLYTKYVSIEDVLEHISQLKNYKDYYAIHLKDL